MNFVHIALEHMIYVAKKSSKSLLYGCFLTNLYKFFKIKLDKWAEIKGNIYGLETFSSMYFVRIRDSWKIEKDCLEKEMKTVSMKKIPKSSIKKSLGRIKGT